MEMGQDGVMAYTFVIQNRHLYLSCVVHVDGYGEMGEETTL